jgi:hypothetical protein
MNHRHPIPRQVHGLADYVYAPTVFTAPESVGFTEQKTATALCRAVGSGVLVSTLLTRAEWGLVRVMPYKTHVTLDFVAGLAAMSAPWLFGFGQHRRARNTFLAMGAVSVAASLLSGMFRHPEEMPRHRQGKRHRMDYTSPIDS